MNKIKRNPLPKIAISLTSFGPYRCSGQRSDTESGEKQEL